MPQTRVYIKPFETDGTYAAEFTEITEDVKTLSDISQGFDSHAFEVGPIRYKGVSVTLRNDHGLYSEVGVLTSLFRYKRKNSIVKVTWDARDHLLYCGFFYAGYQPLGNEVTIFEGVLSDIASTSDILGQEAKFTALGYESLIDEMEVPYASISNGDDFSTIFLAMLDQTPLNALVTVDAGNINPGADQAIDDKTDLENKTVGEVFGDESLLLAANAVFYVEDGVAYVTSRAESASNKYTFYGQGATGGIENIIDVPVVRDGIARLFNYWTWADTALLSNDSDSVLKFGVRKKEMDLSLINDGSTAKIDAILDANLAEFKDQWDELELLTPIDYDTLGLNLRDKVTIDYPTVSIAFDSNPVPRYGLVTYGNARYPYSQSALTIDNQRRWKITGKKINTKNDIIRFSLREVSGS